MLRSMMLNSNNYTPLHHEKKTNLLQSKKKKKTNSFPMQFFRFFKTYEFIPLIQQNNTPSKIVKKNYIPDFCNIKLFFFCYIVVLLGGYRGSRVFVRIPKLDFSRVWGADPVESLKTFGFFCRCQSCYFFSVLFTGSNPIEVTHLRFNTLRISIL